MSTGKHNGRANSEIGYSLWNHQKPISFPEISEGIEVINSLKFAKY